MIHFQFKELLKIHVKSLWDSTIKSKWNKMVSEFRDTVVLARRGMGTHLNMEIKECVTGQILEIGNIYVCLFFILIWAGWNKNENKKKWIIIPL